MEERSLCRLSFFKPASILSGLPAFPHESALSACSELLQPRTGPVYSACGPRISAFTGISSAGGATYRSVSSLSAAVHYHMRQVHAFPYPNPYPPPRPNLHQPSQFQSFLSQFKKKNGQFDFSKMMDTAGQMVSTVNQVGALAKGFIGFFK